MDLKSYDVIFIGYPIWAGNLPRPVAAFLKEAQTAGKTVIPFCTHDGYGSGNSYIEIKEICKEAIVLNGLAMEPGKIAGKSTEIKAWVDELGVIKNRGQRITERRVTIRVKQQEIHGIWEDSPLAREISDKFPLAVSMVGYGGREYYGPLSWRPQKPGSGKLDFADGDITYCPKNNTMAIFYSQSHHPQLTMEVIKVGKLSPDDLSIFQGLGDDLEFTFYFAQ